MFTKTIAIQEIMQPNPRCINQSATLPQVQSIFNLHNYHHLLVVNEEDALVGIISQNDFKYALEQIAKTSSGKIYAEKVIKHWTAERMMTHNPTFLNPEDSIQQASEYFLDNEFHALPILDSNNDIVGILTSHDLLKYAYQ